MPIISYESTAIVADASHTPSEQQFGDVAAVGISVQSARSDHKHGMPGQVGLNVFIGRNSGSAITTGLEDSCVGCSAGKSLTTGSYNSFFGFQAGLLTRTGSYNSFFGYKAGGTSGFPTPDGSYNSYFGYLAGGAATGSDNVFLGAFAGIYETGSNKLFIDNAMRADEADGRVKALIYGIFDALTANQLLAFNAAIIMMSYLPTTDPTNPGQIYADAADSYRLKLSH